MNLNIPYSTPPEFSYFADKFYDRLQQHLDRVQQDLEDDQQLSVLFYSPSGNVTYVDEFGYYNPTLIIIYGMDQFGEETTVLSNVNTTQVVIKVTKIEEGVEKRSIGFVGESS